MKKTVVIAGNSQLAFFVAKLLDNALGDHTHIELIWLTASKSIHPVTIKEFNPERQLENVRVERTRIKSISARDSRIVTGRRTIEYDLLFIDQTPTFTTQEREKIHDQFETLIATIHSNENRAIAAKAKIAFLGNDADSINLALAFAERKNRDSSAAAAAIRVELSIGDKLNTFLQSRGISTRKSQYPGLVIKPPTPYLNIKSLRGIQLDLSGRAITLATLETPNHQNILIVDDFDRQLQNIARTDYQLAKSIVENLLAKLSGELEKPIEISGQKLLLNSERLHFVKLGNMQSERNRARVVASLEKRFWSKLLR